MSSKLRDFFLAMTRLLHPGSRSLRRAPFLTEPQGRSNSLSQGEIWTVGVGLHDLRCDTGMMRNGAP